jgi:endonuclease/exonuclease/phosphatase family metal-dependent hydrolase
MTYNIKSGRYHPDGLEAIARVIEAQSPDILGLQEVDEGMRRTQAAAQADWLTRRLRMRGLFAPAMSHDEGQYGLALLTRWPIVSHLRQPLYQPVYADAAARPRHDSEPRVMLGAKLALALPAPAQRQPATQAPVTGRPALAVTVTHLGLTSDQRAVQVRELAAFARASAGELPALILGDFNCLPDAPELAPLREHFREACAVSHIAGAQRCTFPSGPHGARTADGWRGAIDYIWLSPHIRILSARVPADLSCASDHQPLVVELEL